jgi:acetyl-CoA carboxylase carboxyl transferase subunit alpha
MALAAANSVTMLEHAIYSVISPEGCASILWRDGEQSKDAADSLKLTAQDLLRLGIIESIVDEPLGGAHRSPDATIMAVGDAIEGNLQDLAGLDGGILKSKRREKFLKIGSKFPE